MGQNIQEDKQNKSLKKVAKAEFDRIMYIESTPYCEAKNWYGLHGVIPMGESGKEAYENFMGAL
jgi:hypothetical protein